MTTKQTNLSQAKPDYFAVSFIDDLTPRRDYLVLKRILEVSLILLFSPFIIALTLLTAIVVAIDIGNPIFYTENRHGKNLKKFKIFKFRTIRKTLNFDFKYHEELITPVGKFLRKHKLDELPQFWNVLKGDMSLIGPRPITAELHDEIIKEFEVYDYRYLVKPGITGLGQVSTPHFLTPEGAYPQFEKDVLYIKNISLKTDIKILWKTVMIVFSGKFSR